MLDTVDRKLASVDIFGWLKLFAYVDFIDLIIGTALYM